MASYLVDTNALIFAVVKSSRLTVTAQDVFENGDNELSASAASVYEVGNKHRLGKLMLDPWDFIDAVRLAGIAFQSVTGNVMLLASTLEWDHRDPWDRIIGAQALHTQSVLISSDDDFDAVSELERLW